MDKFSFVKPAKDTRGLRFLYNTTVGRCVLKVLTSPWISVLCGAFLSCGLSKPLILPFIKKNNIDMSEYLCDGFNCFNDFFTRKIRDGKRNFDMSKDAFTSPCDGLLSVYKIDSDAEFKIKNTVYTTESLLKNKSLAETYNGGFCLVFRLCVNHYHRYAFAESGRITEFGKIKGKLHTVRPIALEKTAVFCENSREYTIIETSRIGKLAQIEVGAMLVGKIKNYKNFGDVKRGEEKGMFLYGGSTVVILTEKDRLVIDENILNSTREGYELPVKMGEKIAEASIKTHVS